ncbi:ATP-binding cassette domain-containing protein [Pantoea sp. SoEX]|uniref:ATP-binding cassette domain-containing protein n=1 Tax=Pantoea sp. SoEX TaxID=2576763 RepID=UPI00135B0BF1|nr:ATP-binding cassette domain-containing protein [Pantoea sp. SoEX]MXP51086.1 ATP-binding cassette domain-containing protein [Pantoea sp. SoEX]
MSILIAKNLVKIYESCNIVDNVSLYIKSGEIIGLFGPQNSGKTTIGYMLMGISPISEGKITINEKDIRDFSISNRNAFGIGYIPQKPSIFRNLSVYNNIISIVQIRNDINEREHHIYVDNLMKELHIEHLKDNMGSDLLGSNRKIVEIARTLAANPKFIIMDEPFSNIDNNSRKILETAINYLIKIGIGVLIIEQNAIETLKICKRAYVLNKGKIIMHFD